MANRHAGYKVRTLSREPRKLYVKFTGATDGVGEQTLVNSGPFNDGIVNVVGDASGDLKISLGSSAVKRDTYAHLAGVTLTTDSTDVKLGGITNAEVNHATDPNVAIKLVDSDEIDTNFANSDVAWIIIELLDSKD